MLGGLSWIVVDVKILIIVLNGLKVLVLLGHYLLSMSTTHGLGHIKKSL